MPRETEEETENKNLTPNEYTNQVKSNFNILSQNIMKILENEYNEGRLLGDEYVRTFNQLMQQTLETSRLTLEDYFKSLISVQDYDIKFNTKKHIVDKVILENKKIAQEIKAIDTKSQLEEIKTNSEVKFNHSKVDSIYTELQFKNEELRMKSVETNSNLIMKKVELDNRYAIEKSKVLSDLVGTQLTAWGIMVSSGVLVDDDDNPIVPDFVTNNQINDSIDGINNALNEVVKDDINLTSMDFLVKIKQSNCEMDYYRDREMDGEDVADDL